MPGFSACDCGASETGTNTTGGGDGGAEGGTWACGNGNGFDTFTFCPGMETSRSVSEVSEKVFRHHGSVENQMFEHGRMMIQKSGTHKPQATPFFVRSTTNVSPSKHPCWQGCCRLRPHPCVLSVLIVVSVMHRKTAH